LWLVEEEVEGSTAESIAAGVPEEE